MTLLELLDQQADAILAEAEAALHRAHLRSYERAGTPATHAYLDRLYALTREGIRQRSLIEMVRHAHQVAHARFEAGFDLSEVQTAFNVLEEILWRRIQQALPPEELGQAFGLTSTVLGAGKEALATAYVGLAGRTHTPTLDLTALFHGTDGM